MKGDIELFSQDVTGVPSDTVHLLTGRTGRKLYQPDKISDYGIEEGDEIEVYPVQAGC